MDFFLYMAVNDASYDKVADYNVFIMMIFFIKSISIM